MNTETHQITVSGFIVDVIRKEVKNLHLAVYPPSGRVRVTAPLRMSDDAVRMAVITRMGWIKRQQAKFNEQERQSEREYVTGESHYFQGQRYRLNLEYHNGPARVVLRNKSTMDMFVSEESDATQRKRVFREWYRKQLKTLIPPLIETWEAVIEVSVAEWGVKQMKTKWGSCNPDARRIWLNLELAKKPVQCLEYIIVHEMVHLLERNHTERFTTLVGDFMPRWKDAKALLGSYPLAHETWDY